MDIEVVSYPAVCAGGLILILFGSRKTYRYISYFLFGFGFVYGCPYEKAMEAQVKFLIFHTMRRCPYGLLTNWFYDHRSSTISCDHILLSALHVSAISLPIAAAIILD
jgi:phosphate:Na+ symporter